MNNYGLFLSILMLIIQIIAVPTLFLNRKKIQHETKYSASFYESSQIEYSLHESDSLNLNMIIPIYSMIHTEHKNNCLLKFSLFMLTIYNYMLFNSVFI